MFPSKCPNTRTAASPLQSPGPRLHPLRSDVDPEHYTTPRLQRSAAPQPCSPGRHTKHTQKSIRSEPVPFPHRAPSLAPCADRRCLAGSDFITRPSTLHELDQGAGVGFCGEEAVSQELPPRCSPPLKAAEASHRTSRETMSCTPRTASPALPHELFRLRSGSGHIFWDTTKRQPSMQ